MTSISSEIPAPLSWRDLQGFALLPTNQSPRSPSLAPRWNPFCQSVNSGSSGSELLDSIPRQVYFFLSFIGRTTSLKLTQQDRMPRIMEPLISNWFRRMWTLICLELVLSANIIFGIQLKPLYLHIIINISVQGPQEVDHICQENLPSASVDLSKNYLRILL